MISILLQGFTTGAGLIVAIGAQNAFVIRQGILREHLFLTAFLCSLIDALLIILGVVGFGQVISAYPFAIVLAKYFASVFLFLYGILSFKSAFEYRSLNDKREQRSSSLQRTCLLIMGFSLLNPHVYLDTVILLGSIASQHPTMLRHYFAIGAIVASFSWFFALTYGSCVMAPVLQNPKAWRAIDILIALTMWAMAFTLI